MSRKVQGIVTVVLTAANAGISDLLGRVLGAFGINIDSFIKDFTAATASYLMGTLLTTTHHRLGRPLFPLRHIPRAA